MGATFLSSGGALRLASPGPLLWVQGAWQSPHQGLTRTLVGGGCAGVLLWGGGRGGFFCKSLFSSAWLSILAW